jgi:hypothetical protein
MRKITRLDRFYELRASKHFPRWVVGGIEQDRFSTEYKISDEQKKNIEIIESLSPITDLDTIESLLISDLLHQCCSVCGKSCTETLEVIKDEPYDQPECLMCISCIRKGIEILSE